MTDSLPEPAISWLLKATGCAALDAEQPLVGGWSSDMRRVALRGHAGERRDLVLRRIFREPWRSHAAALLTREATVLELLAGSAIPAPRLVAVDPDGSRAGAPALAMTLLPGRLVLDADVLRGHVGELARVLRRIHAVEPLATTRPRRYESWAAPERLAPPAWSADPDLWVRARALIDRDPPSHVACFLHRDYHPGNVLFEGDQVSGVVDWVETSWGPADLDVAHCSTSLALLCGPGAPRAFRAAYVAAGGRLDEDPGHRAYWALVDALGFLPDPGEMGRPWRRAGRRDLTARAVRSGLEAHVRRIVDDAA